MACPQHGEPMTIRTYNYYAIHWEVGMAVCLNNGRWDEEGAFVPGARVVKVPTPDDLALVLEWPDASLERVLRDSNIEGYADVSLNLKTGMRRG